MTPRRLRRGAAVLAAVLLLLRCSAGDVDDPDGAPAPTPGDEVVEDPPEEAEPAPQPPEDAGPSSVEIPEPPQREPLTFSDDEPAGERRTQLVRRVRDLVAETGDAFEDARLGLLIADEEGRVLVRSADERAMLPASTLKLATAATLLTTLGPETRLRTTVDATAPIDRDGRVRGDLQLRGTGDPVLASAEYGRWVYPARPRTPLEELADQLVAAGVRRVDGDVVGHAEGYPDQPAAEGWRENYFDDFDARRVTGLTVDAGLATELEWEDDEPPDLDDTETRPERVVLEHAERPAARAARELIRLLERRDVDVAGGVRAGEPDAAPVGRLAAVESPPLGELLRFMVQRSDNHLADTLFKVAGRVRTGEGTWERGERAVLQVLDHLGVAHEGVRLADGSGLSRADRVTPRMLVELDLAMTRGRHGEAWRSLMAVAGQEGTLRTRLRGTPAEGRLHAKTGSLRDVAALSGFVRGPEGRRFHFAAIANDATGTDRAVVRAFTDDLALVLVGDLLGCRVREDGDADEGPLERAPLAVAC